MGSTVLRRWRFVVGSGFGQAPCAVTKWLVEFRAQWVCWEGLFELLQGAVDSTTTWYKLILQKDKQLRVKHKEKKLNSLSNKRRHILAPYLAYVWHFNEGLVGLPVLVQLQSDIGGVWWPLHVKNPQSHQTGNQSGVMCRVQKQLPVWERILSMGHLKTKHNQV